MFALLDTHYVEIDDQDTYLLTAIKWHVMRGHKSPTVKYVAGNRGELLHRVILGLKPGDKRQVDHINRDGLDNRRENLRICTSAQNQANRGPNRNNSCGFKGVAWNKTKDAWQATIQVSGKSIYLGRFPTKEEAHEAYRQAATKYFGEFARCV